MLSIVSPVYKADAILPELVKRITAVCEEKKLNYEVILVDDRSPDNSWQVIQDLVQSYPKLRGYRLSRNFGQHYAITAGIAQSKGDSIIIMDCDLQDNPVYIPELLAKKQEGFDVVCSIKQNKEYTWLRRLASNMFYVIVNKLSDVRLEMNLGTMTLIDRKVAEEFLKIKDYHRHSSLIFAWLGFKRGYVKIQQEERFAGKSSYNWKSLLTHAISGVVSQSDKILRWSITAGLLMFIASIMGVIYIVVRSFFSTYEVGWPSLFVLILFTTGIILFMLGILGIYIGKIFEQAKDRPLFIIAEEAGQAI